jgi:hypothetical protein
MGNSMGSHGTWLTQPKTRRTTRVAHTIMCSGSRHIRRLPVKKTSRQFGNGQRRSLINHQDKLLEPTLESLKGNWSNEPWNLPRCGAHSGDEAWQFRL